MLKQQKRSRKYRYNSLGRVLELNVTYDLVFKNGKLVTVYNENGHSIKEGSECFEYFRETSV